MVGPLCLSVISHNIQLVSDFGQKDLGISDLKCRKRRRQSSWLFQKKNLSVVTWHFCWRSKLLFNSECLAHGFVKVQVWKAEKKVRQYSWMSLSKGLRNLNGMHFNGFWIVEYLHYAWFRKTTFDNIAAHQFLPIWYARFHLVVFRSLIFLKDRTGDQRRGEWKPLKVLQENKAYVPNSILTHLSFNR